MGLPLRPSEMIDESAYTATARMSPHAVPAHRNLHKYASFDGEKRSGKTMTNAVQL